MCNILFTKYTAQSSKNPKENVNKYFTNGIYSLKRNICNKIYIDQSGHNLEIRFSEHQSNK